MSSRNSLNGSFILSRSVEASGTAFGTCSQWPGPGSSAGTIFADSVSARGIGNLRVVMKINGNTVAFNQHISLDPNVSKKVSIAYASTESVGTGRGFFKNEVDPNNVYLIYEGSRDDRITSLTVEVAGKIEEASTAPTGGPVGDEIAGLMPQLFGFDALGWCPGYSEISAAMYDYQTNLPGAQNGGLTLASPGRGHLAVYKDNT